MLTQNENEVGSDLHQNYNFFYLFFELESGRQMGERSKTDKIWRKVVLAAYFIGIMKCFEKNVKIIGAIRQSDYMNQIYAQRNEEQIIKRKKYIIYPDDAFKGMWNILIILLLILSGVITPFRVCFIEGVNFDQWQIIDIIFDFLFVIDIVINCLSAFEDEKKNTIDDHKKILYEYATGWFLVDLTAVLPLNYFNFENSQGSSQSYNKLFRLLRLPRLYRYINDDKMNRLLGLLKLQKSFFNVKNKAYFARALSQIGINEGVLQGLILLCKILFLNHLVACFWYFLAKINDFDSNTWVVKNEFQNDSLFKKYIASFEWSLQTLTTVGYGDIPPFTTEERVFSIFWMIFGTGFFSYTLGKLSSILENVDKQKAEYDRRLLRFNDFSTRVQLPFNIKQKVHKYYRNNYLRNVYSSLDPRKVIQVLINQNQKELPSQIRNEVLLIIYQFLRDNIQIFHIDDNFTATLLPHLNFLEVMPEEIIYRQNDSPNDIYFIEKGKVYFNQLSQVNFITRDKYNLTTIIESSFFGEIEALEGIDREYFAIAKEQTNLYKNQFIIQSRFFCSASIFIQILKEYPIVAENVLQIVSRRKQKYTLCIKMINLQRKKKIDSEQVQFYSNTTQHHLKQLAKYENEKCQQKKVRGQVLEQQRLQKVDVILDDHVKHQQTRILAKRRMSRVYPKSPVKI